MELKGPGMNTRRSDVKALPNGRRGVEDQANTAVGRVESSVVEKDMGGEEEAKKRKRPGMFDWLVCSLFFVAWRGWGRSSEEIRHLTKTNRSKRFSYRHRASRRLDLEQLQPKHYAPQEHGYRQPIL